MIEASSITKPGASEIASWSALQEQRVPTDPESRAFFNDIHTKIAPKREDVATWFDCWTWTIMSASAANHEAKRGVL